MLNTAAKTSEETNNRSNQQNHVCACSTDFFVHFLCRCFAPETSQLNVFGRKFRRCFCSLFCFTGVHSRGCLAFLISSSPLYFFHVFIQRDDSPLFIISRPTSFSVIHVKVDIKIKPRERKNRLCCQDVFISKSPGGYEIYLGNGRVLEKQHFTPAYTKEWTYARADFLRIKTDLTSQIYR